MFAKIIIERGMGSIVAWCAAQRSNDEALDLRPCRLAIVRRDTIVVKMSEFD